VDGGWGALKRTLKANDLPFGGKLDQYSVRRWWVDSADADGVLPNDAETQVGHRKAATHLGYRGNSKRVRRATGDRRETTASASSRRR
jgi:hypothetical protein